MAVSRTVQDVVYRALRQLHVIRADETPETADTNTGLSVLQDMMAAWATDGIMIPMATLEHFAFVPNQATYTIGESGTPTLTTTRPENILQVYLLDDAGYTHPIQIISENEYAAILDKNLTNEFPTSVWVQYTSPNLTMKFHEIPDTAYDCYILSNKPFIEPSSLSQDVFTTIQIPRSYHRALADNLAVDLASEYGVQELSPVLMSAAIKGKAALVSASAARRVNPARLELGIAPKKTYSLVDFFAGR